MSDSTPENESGTSQDAPDQGLISDDQLPDDLRPDKNPMAAPSDDDSEGAAAPAAPGGPQDAGGAADAGQPG